MTKSELLDHLMLHLFEALGAAEKLEAMGFLAGHKTLAVLLRDARNEYEREISVGVDQLFREQEIMS